MGAGEFCISTWKQCSCRVVQNCWCNKWESVYYHSWFYRRIMFSELLFVFCLCVVTWMTVAAYTDHHSNGRSPLTWVHSCFVYWSLLHRKISSDMGTFMFRLLIITSQEDLLWHDYILVSFINHYVNGRSPLTWVLCCFVYWSLFHRKISSGIGNSFFRLLIITSLEKLLWPWYFVTSYWKLLQRTICIMEILC
jgi:hypothetical protein